MAALYGDSEDKRLRYLIEINRIQYSNIKHK